MLTTREIIVLIMATITFCGCDGYVKASGIVRETTGEPLGGVVAEIDRGSYNLAMMTGEDGVFEIGSVVAPGRFAVPLYLGKEGYKHCAVRIRSTSENIVEVELARATSPEPSMFSLILDGEQKHHKSPCASVPKDWKPLIRKPDE